MKAEFISTVSHELRTPLTSISGSLGLLANDVFGKIPDQAHQLVEVAHRNSVRLTHMINDLLDMDKLVAGKLVFDMQQRALVPLIRRSIEDNGNYLSEK
jgi:signal transduction histidine kinase